MSCSAKSLSLHLVRKETRHRNHSGPSCNILVRVHSQQIANQPCVWHVSWPHEATNHCWGLRRETTSHANNFLINDTTDGETIEHVTKVLPRFHVVATLARVGEPVDAGDGRHSWFPLKQEEVFRELDLVANKRMMVSRLSTGSSSCSKRRRKTWNWPWTPPQKPSWHFSMTLW